MENLTHGLTEILSLIKYPLFTEKSYKLYDSGKYTFIVDRVLKKKELKCFFERIFSVKVLKINTLQVAKKKKKIGKFWGKKAFNKKVILTLKKNHKIYNVFEKF